MNGKRKLPRAAIAGVAIALVALSVALAFIVPKLGSSAAADGYAKVRVAELVDQTVIEASGNIEAARASDLSFNGSGRIESVLATEGLVVAKGRVLAMLDDTSEAYDLANATYKLEQARLTGNARTAELAALEVELKRAKYELTKLSAPFAGVVTDVAVEPGEYASTGTVIMSLIDRTSLKAVLQIDEIDLPKVRVGQTVEFEFDALPNLSYRGSVSRIPPVGRVTSQGLAVFDVEATIANPPDELLPGYSFSAAILASEARSVLTVPAAAVFPAPRDAAGAGAESPASEAAASPGDEPARTAAASATGLPADPSARRAAFASMTEEQRAALRAQFAASGTPGSGAGLRGAAVATDATLAPAAAALAVYVPGENDEPVLRLVSGVPRSDGTVEIVSGLAAGEWVLVPKSGSAGASGSTAATGSDSLLPNMRFITGGGGPAPSGAPPAGVRP
ncbi:MAG: HlyD family efflux transporter periplasmic adaptor subunit [Spirochaetia bacterium]|nr:HlyD family efflux transporter periplasmic adaptor subunit [Spirochaetia bacterium]